jgi:hypothetical protein
VADNWYTGNATDDAEAHRGWLVGHFIKPGNDARTTDALEVKWGVHPAGESRKGWVTDEKRSTMILLVRGRFRLNLSVGAVVLAREGDYVIWGPGIDHTWEAEEDAIVITVRWPSRENA